MVGRREDRGREGGSRGYRRVILEYISWLGRIFRVWKSYWGGVWLYLMPCRYFWWVSAAVYFVEILGMRDVREFLLLNSSI